MHFNFIICISSVKHLVYDMYCFVSDIITNNNYIIVTTNNNYIIVTAHGKRLTLTNFIDFRYVQNFTITGYWQTQWVTT